MWSIKCCSLFLVDFFVANQSAFVYENGLFVFAFFFSFMIFINFYLNSVLLLCNCALAILISNMQLLVRGEGRIEEKKVDLKWVVPPVAILFYEFISFVFQFISVQSKSYELSIKTINWDLLRFFLWIMVYEKSWFFHWNEWEEANLNLMLLVDSLMIETASKMVFTLGLISWEIVFFF